MQPDMAQGLCAYVLTLPRIKERPPVVGIFEPVSPVDAATVDEQDRFITTGSRRCHRVKAPRLVSILNRKAAGQLRGRMPVR